jgi:hypothetical protein
MKRADTAARPSFYYAAVSALSVSEWLSAITVSGSACDAEEAVMQEKRRMQHLAS